MSDSVQDFLDKVTSSPTTQVAPAPQQRQRETPREFAWRRLSRCDMALKVAALRLTPEQMSSFEEDYSYAFAAYSKSDYQSAGQSAGELQTALESAIREADQAKRESEAAERLALADRIVSEYARKGVTASKLLVVQCLEMGGREVARIHLEYGCSPETASKYARQAANEDRAAATQSHQTAPVQTEARQAKQLRDKRTRSAAASNHR